MGLCLIFAVSWLSFKTVWTIFSVVFGLGMVIFVHELGHFIVAKLCGVKCEKFYVGFDPPMKIGPWHLPRTLGKFQWGETEYGIGIIPLGGYVKMLGQDDNPANYQAEAERIKVNEQEPVSSEPESANQDPGTSPKSDEDRVADEIDPRSYPAKSVPRRMAIISAGVVMNVIFAVIFAALAYRWGVEYTPCTLGGTLPGYPAWVSNLQPGDRIIQIGRKGEPNEQLRFFRDLKGEVMLEGKDGEIDFLIRRGTDSHWVTLRPATAIGDRNDAAIGVLPVTGTTLMAWRPVRKSLSEIQEDPLFLVGDKVLAINGSTLESGTQLLPLLANLVDQPMTVTVQRSSNKTSSDGATEVTVNVPRIPLRRLGLVMRPGPITAIQNGSPAHQAGFQKGDIFKTMNGQPIGDPMTLADRCRQMAGETATFEVLRNGEKIGLSALLERPNTYVRNLNFECPVPIEALGVIFAVTNVVESVNPQSPAETAGMNAGDELSSVEFFPSSKTRRREEGRVTGDLNIIELNPQHMNWPHVFFRMQRILDDTQIKISYQRNGEKHSTSQLDPVLSDEWFLADRGFLFEAETDTLHIQKWYQAFSLGCQQTKDDLMMVVKVLKKLATGGLSPTNLGGPFTIVAAAGNEASVGLGRLLLFLTLLSANLAVINFLPIPVLDGGHLLFLVVEAILGKPLNERLQFHLTLVGLVFILSLMIFVIGLDVFRFLPMFH